MYSAWHVMSTQYFLLKKLLIIEVQTKLLGAQQVSREHLGEVREITNSTLEANSFKLAPFCPWVNFQCREGELFCLGIFICSGIFQRFRKAFPAWEKDRVPLVRVTN